MSTASDYDPYLLPLPNPASPVIKAELVKPTHAHLNGRYADSVWSLAPLIENPSSVRVKIAWRLCPTPFDEELRLALWNLINGELRPTFVHTRPKTISQVMRTRLSPSAIVAAARVWFHMATWLQSRGITTLAHCTSEVLHEHALYLATLSVSSKDVARRLLAITRLWALDELSAKPAGIAQPPWEVVGFDQYVSASHPIGPENATPPLAEATISPLLIWAMRVVEDLSDDILAAHAEVELIHQDIPDHAEPGGVQRLNAYLDHLLSSDDPLPIYVPGARHAITLANNYICGNVGVTKNQVTENTRRQDVITAAAHRPWGCPLTTPITGRIAGRPWRNAIDYFEAATLWRHLGTAAFVVCAYLTGMRPPEVLGLRTGCCPEPISGSDGTIGRHLIYGRHYKTALDEHGNHAAAGEQRDVPWVAIRPVVNAIRVLEQMVPHEALLFDNQIHDIHRKSTNTGAILGASMRTRIADFIDWANREADRHNLAAEAIAPDPNPTIGVSRFRRTLAWHIARRPNGHIALAIQYGHMRSTMVTERYAGRGRDGIHHLIDVETARAVADTIADLQDDLDNGAGISGPAAREVINIAAHTPRFTGTAMNATTARRLLANSDLILYNNPQALLLCRYKPDRALCQRQGINHTPNLDDCRPNCTNIARTDYHAVRLRIKAEQLEGQSAHTPQPIGDRLRANAARLRSYADAHDTTKITAKTLGVDEEAP
jgi:hypothetical protein